MSKCTLCGTPWKYHSENLKQDHKRMIKEYKKVRLANDKIYKQYVRTGKI